MAWPNAKIAFVVSQGVVVLLNSKLQVGKASLFITFSSPFPLPLSLSLSLSISLLDSAKSIQAQNRHPHSEKKPHSSESAVTRLKMEESTLLPPWLEPLLSTSFFSICRAHGDATRSECNMYCLDCAGGDAFCYYCRGTRHKDHQVIQIRRSSYHDVVRVSEVQKFLDISGVQTYVINSARVMFLNERPQPKTGKGVAHICEMCGRSLLDPFRFCSLGCKVAGIKRNGDGSLVLEKNIEAEGGVERKHREGISGLREGSHHAIYPSTPPPSTNPRRRKGIPHRAPFGS